MSDQQPQRFMLHFNIFTFNNFKLVKIWHVIVLYCAHKSDLRGLCAGGAYDLLFELQQPAAGGGSSEDGGGAGLRLTSQASELVLLRRKLEKTEHLLVSDRNTDPDPDPAEGLVQ